jgi:hypothetical protein
MTELLKDTLTERADSTEPPALDLDGIISAGDRRIRRRRAGSVLGAAMVALAVIAGGIFVAGSRDHEPPPVSAGFTERRATYAIGSEIHYGQDVISVAPEKVAAFVQTDAGFVFVSDKAGVFVADSEGVHRIRPDDTTTRLVADDHGNLVGWVEVEVDADKIDSVIFDVAADRELVRTELGNKRSAHFELVIGPRIVAIDGETAYFGTLDGLYRWDLKAGSGKLIAKMLPNGARGVSSGQYVVQRPLEHPSSGTGLAVGPTPSDTGGRAFPGKQGYLSPGADYLVAGPADNWPGDPAAAALGLFSVSTGQKLALRHPGHPRLIFSQWLNDTTFTAVGLRSGAPAPPVDLLTCSTTTLTCQVTAPAFSTYTFDPTPPRTTPFALPLGTEIIQDFR